MGIKVLINSIPKTRVSINNQERKTIRAVAVVPAESSGANRLVELLDVDASSVDNNETIVYDEVSAKFVVKELPIINGGTF